MRKILPLIIGLLYIGVSPVMAQLGLSTTVTDVLCNGTANGAATVTATTGATPYTYLWSDGQTTNIAAGLAAGNFDVTVQDALSVTEAVNMYIGAPAALVYNPNFSDPVCYGHSNGQAAIVVIGGTTPYSYIWNDGQISTTATGLGAGFPSVTITDFNGCKEIVNFTLTDPAQVTANVTATDAICFETCNGTASVTPIIGVAPFTVFWSDAQTGLTAANLCDGTYTVTVSDANGCIAQRTAIVGQPTLLTASIAAYDKLTCYQSGDGWIQAAASGGTPPYSYLWIDGQTMDVATGLSVGTYTLTITDANGCKTTTQQPITEPTQLDAIITSSNNTYCFGSSYGSATVSASGGILPYNYNWSDGQTSTTASGLYAGNHIVTVTDNNGCFTTAAVTITQPPALLTSFTPVQPHCGQSDGEICVSMGGGTGTGTYTYSWRDISGTPITNVGCAGNIPGGCYILDVLDANACTKRDTVCLVDIDGPVIAYANHQDVTCAGASDGLINFNVIGGTTPIVYQWYNDHNVLLPQFNGSTAAWNLNGDTTYTCNVSDGAGCVATLSQYINEPDPIGYLLWYTNANCIVGSDGSATIEATGGISPYAYLWSDAQNQTTNAVTGLNPGNYSISITDSNGCSSIGAVDIGINPGFTVSITSSDAKCGSANGQAEINVTSRGQTPFSYVWNTGITTNQISGLNVGLYSATTTDGTGCASINTVAIENSEPQLNVLLQNNVNCFGDSDGSIIIEVTGGLTPYAYNWLPNGTGTSSSISGLSAGIYLASISDANGCFIGSNFNLTEPNEISIIIDSIIQPSCDGASNGAVYTNVTAGITPYQYTWSSINNTTSAVTGLAMNTYTLTVTDASGCLSDTNMVLNGIQTVFDSIFICSGDSVLIYGNYQKIAGVYINSLVGIGCDSIFNTNLIFYPSVVNTTFTHTMCSGDSVFVGSLYQTNAGVYFDSLQTSNGCDSIIETTISINNLTTKLVNVSICFGDSIYLQGAFQNVAGTYLDTIQPIGFCDTLLQTTLSFYSASETIDTVMLCNGDSVLLHGNYILNYGFYGDTLSSFLGCDSIVGTYVNPMIDTSIYVQNAFIISNDNNASEFQWIDCGSESILPYEEYPIFVPYYSGSYAVEIRNSGCVDTSNCITVECTAYFQYYEDTTGQYAGFIFDLGFGGDGVTYLWDFGDGSTPVSDWDEYTYANSGVYNLCVTVSDDTGCDNVFCNAITIVNRSSGYTIQQHKRGPKTSISEHSSSNSIKAYPNPFNTSVTIEVLGETAQQMSLQLTDVQGRKHREITSANNKFVLSREDLASGVYFYSIRTKNELIGTGKLLVE